MLEKIQDDEMPTGSKTHSLLNYALKVSRAIWKSLELIETERESFDLNLND